MSRTFAEELYEYRRQLLKARRLQAWRRFRRRFLLEDPPEFLSAYREACSDGELVVLDHLLILG